MLAFTRDSLSISLEEVWNYQKWLEQGLGALTLGDTQSNVVYLQELMIFHIFKLLYSRKCLHTPQILTAAGDGCNGLHRKPMACLVDKLAMLCEEIDVSHIISILNLKMDLQYSFEF